jgi:cytosine/adenosine deaminase-related metal-dependent hydrolase
MPSSKKAQHAAAWVLPMTGPPLRRGYVAVDGGEIVDVGTLPTGAEVPSIAILPGLVNAHTHLELSWMKGRIPPDDSMPAWAQRLITLRLSSPGGGPVPMVEAIAAVRASGTTLVGDVTNSLATYDLLAASELSAAVFYEQLGFNAAMALPLIAAAKQQLSEVRQIDRVRATIVPHAPYSVSPELMRAIAGANPDGRPISIHAGESPEEMQFLKEGSGPWRDLLERLGVWSPHWAAPGCGPVEYLDRLGLLNDRLVAVHGVQLTDDELGRLAAAGATLVTCPRSNRWTGAGTPPIDRFYASGVSVALGTDSLASVDDLNLFAEMAAVRSIAPSVPARDILRSATLEGARALGFGGELGAIAPGLGAELLAVRLPAQLDAAEDVEEYLVRGVSPSDVTWL